MTRPGVECGAGAVWTPLRWGGVPGDVEELVLLITRFHRPKRGERAGVKVPYASLITGIEPRLRGIPVNSLPEGSEHVSARPLHGCPQRPGIKYLFWIFAIEEGERIRGGSLGLRAAAQLTEEALGVQAPVRRTPLGDRIAESTAGSGGFVVTYGRG